jgi:hypothetical protein
MLITTYSCMPAHTLPNICDRSVTCHSGHSHNLHPPTHSNAILDCLKVGYSSLILHYWSACKECRPFTQGRKHPQVHKRTAGKSLTTPLPTDQNASTSLTDDLHTTWWFHGAVRGHLSVSLPPLLYSHLPSHTHPCSYIHPPTLCTIITRHQTLEVNDSQTPQTSMSLWESTPIVVDIPLPPSLLPLELRTSFRHIGTGLCDTTAPSAVTWTPIYGRLGTRRLGTVFLCISL